MPWVTPTLRTVRETVRDNVTAALSGAVLLGNSVLRVMSDAMAGLAHGVYRYLDWIATQLMPDTAEQEWLDRHGVIWLVNSDGSKGRKAATYAIGTVQFAGVDGTVIPIGTTLSSGGVEYETTTEGNIGLDGLGSADVEALTAGLTGNRINGDTFFVSVDGVDSAEAYGDITGGVETETDEQLRDRVLLRIQNPPMGGSAADYVRWALAVPGVTRAWAAAEQGPGTITVRFLMDDMYPPHGIPALSDIQAVTDAIDDKRPVTVMGSYVVAPVLYYYNITIENLTDDSESVRARIEASIRTMERNRSAPGQTMYRSWVDEAISQAVGEETHELLFTTTAMPAPGYMPTLGTVTYLP